MSTDDIRHIKHMQWLHEAHARFGPDPMKWRFICPACHHVASGQDWIDAGATRNAIGVECIGRYAKTDADKRAAKERAFGRKGGPCNYAGYGLFRISPVRIDMGDGGPEYHCFEFGPAEAPEQPQEYPQEPQA